ncbi:MAG: hypothetical protein QM811_00315 [Pirellulales bacterium]
MTDLNTTLIAIRERGLPEICDLGLRVLRTQFKPLFLAALIGMLPCALFNWWWLSKLPHENMGDRMYYAFGLLLLGWWQLPWATAPLTLVLGQVMFQQRIDFGLLRRNSKPRFPQLAWYMTLRTLLMPHGLIMAYPRLWDDMAAMLVILFLLWLIPVLRWSYLTEVILLEKNPWTSKTGQLTTGQRNKALHGGDSGMVFARGFSLAVLELVLIGMLFFGGWYLYGNIVGEIEITPGLFQFGIPAAFWATQAYMAVVRFLCYLDLRIRREGWEVDLALRSEAALMERQAAGVQGRPEPRIADPLPV